MNTQELKDLILWCKANKVKSLCFEGTSFEISDIGIAEEVYKNEELQIYKPNSKTFADLEKIDEKDEEELLFASAD